MTKFWLKPTFHLYISLMSPNDPSRSGQKLLADREFERKVKEYNDYGLKVSGSSKLELTSRLVSSLTQWLWVRVQLSAENNDRLFLENLVKVRMEAISS